MRFHKNVPLEHREILAEQLKKYEKEMAMTSEERKELHKWVASGRSPYDNGDYIYGENGWPMDFVSAMRFEADQMEWFASLVPAWTTSSAYPKRWRMSLPRGWGNLPGRPPWQ